MELLLTTALTAPVLGSILAIGFGLALLLLLTGFSIYAGLYYSIPRMLLKWFSRRAIQVA